MKTSSTAAGRRSRMWRIWGWFRRGTSAFGRLRVRGRRRVPKPPAIMTACIDRSKWRGGYGVCGDDSPRNDRDDVVPAEHDRADPPDLLVPRFLRVLEDHVHVVVVSDELALEEAVILEEELDALIDRLFQNVERHHHGRLVPQADRRGWAGLNFCSRSKFQQNPGMERTRSHHDGQSLSSARGMNL